MHYEINTQTALKHFKISDPVMATLCEQALKHSSPVTIPTPKKPEEYFASIVKSIVSQQISTKAAKSVFGRLTTLLGGEIIPETITKQSEETLRDCGLSGQKTKYLQYNAEHWHTIRTNELATLPTEEVIRELTTLYGIGTWTAEMFLMFTLARPDVFSFGDLALIQSIYHHYPVKPHHNRKINSLVESWSPHRTLASLTLWWHKTDRSISIKA